MNDLTLPCVLLVEDDGFLRRFIVRALRKVAEVFPAASAAEGARLLLARTFDVVVSDLSLPDKDGFTFLAHAARLRPGAKLVLYSERTPSPTARRAVEVGLITAALHRSGGVEELVDLVRHMRRS